jgi:hypothetical protein
MRKAEYMTTAAFPEPNYTQTPNDFFAMVPSMSDAELRVTLVMIRQTFGFHRDGFKMGVSKLADAAGLSRQGTLDGAEKAEIRGTFRRTNPDSNTEAEWELVVDLQPVDTPLQPVEGNPQTGGGLSGVKERKEIKKKGDLVDGLLFYGKQAKEQGEDKVENVIQNLEREFRANFQRSTKIQGIARFILEREKHGETLMKFVVWAKRDDFNASRLYEYAEQPEKIRTRWPQAFTAPASPLPTVDQMDEWRKGINL